MPGNSSLPEALAALREVSPGDTLHEAITAERINAIITCIKRLAEGENISVPRGFKTSHTGGVTLDFTGGGAGGAPTSPDPFEPLNASVGDDKKVTVTFGIVNNIVPTIADTPLDAEDAPTLSISGTRKIYLQTNWTGDEPKSLESAEVKFTEGDVPEDTSERGHQLLSTISIDEGGAVTINKGVTHSLRVERMHCPGTTGPGTTEYGWAGV